MNKADYAKTAKLAAGGALVAVGLWRRSLFGLVVSGIGVLLIQRTLKPKRDGNSETQPTPNVEVFGVKEDAAEPAAKSQPSEKHHVHVADLASDADTLDGVRKG